MDKNINYENLTYKDIVTLLLQNAQHMVTRDELKTDNQELKNLFKEEISNTEKKLNEKIETLDIKIDNVEKRLNEKIEALDIKIDNVEKRLNEKIDKLELKIDKIDSKFDRLQWLIIATILTILLKDYIIKIFS